MFSDLPLGGVLKFLRFAVRKFAFSRPASFLYRRESAKCFHDVYMFQKFRKWLDQKNQPSSELSETLERSRAKRKINQTVRIQSSGWYTYASRAGETRNGHETMIVRMLERLELRLCCAKALFNLLERTLWLLFAIEYAQQSKSLRDVDYFTRSTKNFLPSI